MSVVHCFSSKQFRPSDVFYSEQWCSGCFLSTCASQPGFGGTLLFDSTVLSLLESLKARHLQKRTVLQTWSAAWSLGTPPPGHTRFQRISGGTVAGTEVALLMLKIWVEQDAREGGLLLKQAQVLQGWVYSLSLYLQTSSLGRTHHQLCSVAS